MAVAYPSRDVKVYLETSDGQVIELTGAVVDMSIYSGYEPAFDFGGEFMPIAKLQEFEFTIRGTGATFTSKEFTQKLMAEKQASEWLCSYCGLPNRREARYCGQEDHGKGCGAPRSFIYDV